MIPVRFLRTKRYPHPNGPKRRAGTVMPIIAALASLWARNGVVELTDQAVAELDLGGMTVAELKKVAADLGVELGQARKKDDIAAAIHAAITQPRDAGPADDDPPPPPPDPAAGGDTGTPPAAPPAGDDDPGTPATPSDEGAGGAGLTD